MAAVTPPSPPCRRTYDVSLYPRLCIKVLSQLLLRSEMRAWLLKRDEVRKLKGSPPEAEHVERQRGDNGSDPRQIELVVMKEHETPAATRLLEK